MAGHGDFMSALPDEIKYQILIKQDTITHMQVRCLYPMARIAITKQTVIKSLRHILAEFDTNDGYTVESLWFRYFRIDDMIETLDGPEMIYVPREPLPAALRKALSDLYYIGRTTNFRYRTQRQCQKLLADWEDSLLDVAYPKDRYANNAEAGFPGPRNAWNNPPLGQTQSGRSGLKTT